MRMLRTTVAIIFCAYFFSSAKCDYMPSVCGENEIRVNQPGCDRTCSNYYQASFICNPDSYCLCRDGYVRNNNTICIRIEDCTREDTTCPSNQYFSYNAERKTCDPLHYKQSTSGCFCKTGLVLDMKKKICIYAAECCNSTENRDCHSNDPNSEYKVKRPDYTRNMTCDPEPDPSLDNGFQCYCKRGFYLARNGTCVKECEKCPLHSSYSPCPQSCRGNCSNMLRSDLSCIAMCQPGCDCDEGYVLNDNGECIKKKDCDPRVIQCPDLQKFNPCRRKYAPTCQDQCGCNYEERRCQWGCFCEDPYVYDSVSKGCVYPSECPKSDENKKCRTNDPNSEYKECVPAKIEVPSCRDKQIVDEIQIVCWKGCRCISGYSYNILSKKCVSYNQCTNQ